MGAYVHKNGIKRCTPSMDSSLEEFDYDPRDVSIIALACPLTGFTKYPNLVADKSFASPSQYILVTAQKAWDSCSCTSKTEPTL